MLVPHVATLGAGSMGHGYAIVQALGPNCIYVNSTQVAVVMAMLLVVARLSLLIFINVLIFVFNTRISWFGEYTGDDIFNNKN